MHSCASLLWLLQRLEMRWIKAAIHILSRSTYLSCVCIRCSNSICSTLEKLSLQLALQIAYFEMLLLQFDLVLGPQVTVLFIELLQLETHVLQSLLRLHLLKL